MRSHASQNDSEGFTVTTLDDLPLFCQHSFTNSDLLARGSSPSDPSGSEPLGRVNYSDSGGSFTNTHTGSPGNPRPHDVLGHGGFIVAMHWLRLCPTGSGGESEENRSHRQCAGSVFRTADPPLADRRRADDSRIEVRTSHRSEERRRSESEDSSVRCSKVVPRVTLVR